MPKFLDSHPVPGPVVPAQVVRGQVMQGMRADIQVGRPDAFGVKGINVFVAQDRLYCLTEASSVEAVCKSHAAKGIRLEPEQVTEVASLL